VCGVAPRERWPARTLPSTRRTRFKRTPTCVVCAMHARTTLRSTPLFSRPVFLEGLVNGVAVRHRVVVQTRVDRFGASQTSHGSCVARKGRAGLARASLLAAPPRHETRRVGGYVAVRARRGKWLAWTAVVFLCALAASRGRWAQRVVRRCAPKRGARGVGAGGVWCDARCRGWRWRCVVLAGSSGWLEVHVGASNPRSASMGGSVYVAHGGVAEGVLEGRARKRAHCEKGIGSSGKSGLARIGEWIKEWIKRRGL
jgi:hypothetical protein